MFTRRARASVDIHSPVPGRILPLSEVPDPVFAGEVVGPGFAVDPTDGHFVSPVDGTVTVVPDSRHAVGIAADHGVEVLVHIGIDSVACQGEGFVAHVAAGDRVRIGDPLLDVDVATVAGRIPSMISPVVVTNSNGMTVGGITSDPAPGQPVVTVR